LIEGELLGMTIRYLKSTFMTFRIVSHASLPRLILRVQDFGRGISGGFRNESVAAGYSLLIKML